MHKLYLFSFFCAGLSLAKPYDPAHQIITRVFGLDKMTAIIDEQQAAIQKESYLNAVSLEQALHAALTSFLEDNSDTESPLALIESDDDSANPSVRLRRLLNRPTTTLALVSNVDFLDTTRVYPPERGEKLAEFWIFYLAIPDYSDHLFWAMVSRSDVANVYNYGFN